MHKAVDELANKETFHGYGPEQGYDFLIDAVIRNDYAPRGVYLEPGEVFISDGAKSDTGNIGDILRHHVKNKSFRLFQNSWGNCKDCVKLWFMVYFMNKQ